MLLTFCGQGEGQADTAGRRRTLTSCAKFSHEQGPRPSPLRRTPFHRFILCAALMFTESMQAGPLRPAATRYKNGEGDAELCLQRRCWCMCNGPPSLLLCLPPSLPACLPDLCVPEFNIAASRHAEPLSVMKNCSRHEFGSLCTQILLV